MRLFSMNNSGFFLIICFNNNNCGSLRNSSLIERSDDLEMLSNRALSLLFLLVFPVRLIFDFEFPIFSFLLSSLQRWANWFFTKKKKKKNYELYNPLISSLGGKILLRSRIGHFDEE